MRQPPTEAQLSRAKALAEALRAELPARFEWNFSVSLEKRSCGSSGCAMGLGVVLGLIEAGWIANDWDTLVEAAFGMTRAEILWIFWGEAYDDTPGSPSPQNVARVLEHWIETRELIVGEELQHAKF